MLRYDSSTAISTGAPGKRAADLARQRFEHRFLVVERRGHEIADQQPDRRPLDAGLHDVGMDEASWPSVVSGDTLSAAGDR